MAIAVHAPQRRDSAAPGTKTATTSFRHGEQKTKEERRAAKGKTRQSRDLQRERCARRTAQQNPLSVVGSWQATAIIRPQRSSNIIHVRRGHKIGCTFARPCQWL
jgi:hypothetical protein